MCERPHTTPAWVEESRYIQRDLEKMWNVSITSAFPACKIVTPLLTLLPPPPSPPLEQ